MECILKKLVLDLSKSSVLKYRKQDKKITKDKPRQYHKNLGSMPDFFRIQMWVITIVSVCFIRKNNITKGV